MDCVKVPFGRIGASFFAGANVLQLIGWTAVMIATGAGAAQALLPTVPLWALCVFLGVLVALWIRIGLGNAVKLNTVAMALLFVLSLVLFVRVASGNGGSEVLEAAETPLRPAEKQTPSGSVRFRRFSHRRLFIRLPPAGCMA